MKKREEERESDLIITEQNINLDIIKNQIKDIGDVINILEEEILKNDDEFDKSKIAFYVGRLETLFIHTAEMAGWLH